MWPRTDSYGHPLSYHLDGVHTLGWDSLTAASANWEGMIAGNNSATPTHFQVNSECNTAGESSHMPRSAWEVQKKTGVKEAPVCYDRQLAG